MTYRLGVGAVIVNNEGKLFLAERIDNPGAWQFPQGGIDEGELPIHALFRELEEEIGVKNITVIKETKDWLTYDLPKIWQIKLEREWGKHIKGQRQKWFLCTIDESEINIKTEHPEFSVYKWANIDEVIDACVDFKKNVYEAVLKEFFENS